MTSVWFVGGCDAKSRKRKTPKSLRAKPHQSSTWASKRVKPSRSTSMCAHITLSLHRHILTHHFFLCADQASRRRGEERCSISNETTVRRWFRPVAPSSRLKTSRCTSPSVTQQSGCSAHRQLSLTAILSHATTSATATTIVERRPALRFRVFSPLTTTRRTCSSTCRCRPMG